MHTPRLPVVGAPADLNVLVRFAERRNLVSARVPSHFNWPLPLACDRVTADLPSLRFVAQSNPDLRTYDKAWFVTSNPGFSRLTYIRLARFF